MCGDLIPRPVPAGVHLWKGLIGNDDMACPAGDVSLCSPLVGDETSAFERPIRGNRDSHLIDVDFRGGSGLKLLKSNPGRFESCFGSFFCLINHRLSVIGRDLGVMERPRNQHDADASKNDRAKRSDEHPHRPEDHALLGLQIAYFTLFLPLVVWLVWLGYQVADRGLYSLDRGQKARGALLFWSGILLAYGSAFLLPYGGYWLMFEGRTWRLLS